MLGSGYVDFLGSHSPASSDPILALDTCSSPGFGLRLFLARGWVMNHGLRFRVQGMRFSLLGAIPYISAFITPKG